MTPKQRKLRFGKLTYIGCIVCKNQGYGWTPPEIHHLKGHPWSAMGMRASDEHTIPLCPAHHRFGHEREIGFHQSPAAFQDKYGSQQTLLQQVEAMLDE